MEWLAPERYLAAMESETARLAAVIGGRDPGESVPACPEWTLRDLVTHVGTGHRLAAGVVEREARTSPGYELIPAPDAVRQWPDWLVSGSERLRRAVAEHGFGTEVWTWSPRYRTAGFWLRRMLHDLVIHRFDATPGDDFEIDGDLAADGVADMLLCIETLSRSGARMAGVRGSGETLLFTDGDRSWQVTLTPDGATWRDGDGPADVVCRAPAAQLLLMLNRRRAPGPVDGDRELLARWREHTRF
ncbi:hypothetical protein GCM10010168_23920 [Actinoplanes ianthinogenes]|uniref:Mycothiol-dependent maleylpyruvate isomerase metal-binding domain-containing protein n=1 Tax=Actinoplanes ianthinogenes TaxID=122358 RepID=A0ABM7M8Q0_9ACTN|nr:maleylpyruvate isomerase family mycothiol-dependent enzyme [Actinoplanes ianthinogenes]BCJ48033.1 hypothetical protein Aiant_86900 [Actinoplanes ianthinogenes]GGR05904.1 hypothetical protein GCM10010168_23920 [Actinoplanes ianthinogenes]